MSSDLAQRERLYDTLEGGGAAFDLKVGCRYDDADDGESSRKLELLIGRASR